MKVPKIKKLKKKPKEKREKKKTGKKKNMILMILITLGILAASAVLAFALYIIITSPDFEPKKLYNKEATVIYANDGKTELARYANKNVEPVTYSELPQVLIDALVATEDSRFFQHNGLDAARFIKASIGQLAGKDAGGASTLSMQVMKNTFNGSESSGIAGIVRKFKDIYMSVFKLEAVYTKEEIIEFYVNSQWLGAGSTYYESINGVEQGSQYFFGKSVSDLTLPEASLLVGIFNNPVAYNPYDHPVAATNRRSTVLSLMVRHGYITEEEKEFAESVTVESLLADHSIDNSSEYQAFIEFVAYQVQQETGDDPYNVPMAIYTTLDPSIQKVLNQLEKGELYKFPTETVQFGMAVTSVEDGSILALSGGRNYAPRGTNRAVGSSYYPKGIKRQPGSTAKPIFDFGPYIEYLHGSTSTIFIDQPWTYTTGGSVLNYDRSYKGAITMRYALQDSRNVPAVQAFQQVAKQVGLDKIADFVHSLGIDYGDNLYESAAIGGVECADPLSMSAAYAAFGRGGYYIEPYSFTKIVYLETDEVHTHKVNREKVMSEQTAYMVTDMLVSGGASGVGGNFSISGTQIAAKGGTTTIDSASAKKLHISTHATPDHWNITYSPDYSIALWLGYDSFKDHGPYLTSGIGNPARKAIMKAVATKIYKKNSKFSRPSSVVAVTTEKETYPTMLASANTPDNLKQSDLYKSGYEPSEVSPRFDTLENPTNGKYQYNGTTITLSWDPIKTPDAINPDYLETYYNQSEYWKFYEKYKTKYYEERIKYNNTYVGTIGYQIYLKDSTGNLISLGYTNNTNYTYTPNSTTSNYTFVIKSAYSIFKNNMSTGLTIDASVNVDTNIGNIGGPTDTGSNDNQDNHQNDNSDNQDTP